MWNGERETSEIRCGIADDYGAQEVQEFKELSVAARSTIMNKEARQLRAF